MANKLSLSRKKTQGQAMVEFALILPILLLMVYGLMETGRLLFIYASTVTAARQAARYGAATGTSDNGMPYYQDCAGITTAANRLGIIHRFNQIEISYDGGVDANLARQPVSQPPAPGNDTPDCGEYAAAQNGDRVMVTVQTRWEPITPLLPFEGFDITSTSARTILASVPINVTALPPTFSGTGAHISVSTTASSSTYSSVGQVITFTYTITSDGSATVNGAFTLSDSTGQVSNITCSTNPPSLPIGSTMTCTSARTITQADLDNGYFSHTIVFDSSNAPDGTNTHVIYAVQNPQITLVKSSNVAASTTSVTYTYVLQNTGNVTIKSSDGTANSYEITDDKIGAICSNTVNLAPGNQVTCTKAYTVTNADKNAGEVINVGTATAYYQRYESGTNSYVRTPVTVNSNTVTVYTAALSLNILYEPAVFSTPQTITFRFRVYNNTNATITNPDIEISSFTGDNATAADLQTMINNTGDTDGGQCPATIGAGSSGDCTVTYAVNQADIDIEEITITARAISDSGLYNSKYMTRTITIAADPKMNLTVAVSPGNTSANPATKINSVVTYTYTVTNTGNVTLTVTVSDPTVTTTSITCAASTLAPGASTTCTGTRTMTDEELDNNSFVTSTGTATGVFKGRNYYKTATATVWTSSGPRMKLTVTGTPTSFQGEGVTISLSYTITNTGNATLNAPFTWSGLPTGATTPSCAASVAPGASITCTGTYVTKQTDLTASGLTSSITVTSSGASSVTSNPVATLSIPFIAPTTCVVKHSVLSSSTSGMGMTIRNDNAYGIRISLLEVTFTDRTSPDQFINLVTINGTTIWSSNSNNDSPYTINSGFVNTGAMLIAPNATVSLSIGFKRSYTSSASQKIIVRFSSPGCTDYILDSSDLTQLQ